MEPAYRYFYDDDDDETNDMFQAFAVEGERPPELGPPEDGIQFLQRVRWETRRCPKVVVATDIDTRAYDHQQTPGYLPPTSFFADAPEGMSPSLRWRQEFLASFSVYRQSMARIKEQQSHFKFPSLRVNLPSHHNAAAWCTFCFGSSREADPNIPLLGIVMRLDHMFTVAVLSHLVEWFREKKIELLGPNHLTWFYALLTFLEKPLDGDTSFTLRTLLTHCCARRALLVDPKDSLLPSLNVIITIISQYFRQAIDVV